MAAWVVGGVTGSTAGSWTVARISGSTTGTVQPVTLAPVPDAAALPFDRVIVRPVLGPGSPTPDSYTFTLVPNADVRSIVLTPLGGSVTFTAPGRFVACSVQIRIDAISGGTVVDSSVATVNVPAHSDFIRVGTSWVAISRPRVLSRTGPAYSALRTMRTAFSGAQTDAVVLVSAGSSSTAGTAASDPAHRYVNLLAARIQSAYPSPSVSEAPVIADVDANFGAAPTAYGIHPYNSGQGSTTSATYLTDVEIARITALNPDVVTHMIGSNDFSTGITPTAYRANVAAVLAKIQAGTPTVTQVLIQSYERYDLTSYAYPWAQYGAALKSIAASDPTHLAFIDVSPAFYSIGIPNTDPRGYMASDHVHLNDDGHAYLAKQIGDALGIPALGITDVTAAPTPAPPPVVASKTLTRVGTGFQVGGVPTRLSGLNAYWLGLDDNNGGVNFPSKATITSAISGMREMGVNLVRAHTIGISAGTSLSFETAPGVFSDANLDAADWAVYQAKQAGIFLMVPLTDMWNYYHGGKGVFVHWAFQQGAAGVTDVPQPTHLFDANGSEKGAGAEDQFFTSAPVRALFKAYISAWLNHVNPYTGLAYKDDPTIAIIETGNEIYKAAQQTSNEWTQDIASYVKSIAPSKYLADGSAADRVAVSASPGLTASAIDILGAHYYPQQQSGAYPPVEFNDSSAGYPAGTALQQLAADATAASNAGKPFIVGEFPWTRSTVASWYSAIETNTAIDGDMAWSFIGGSEVHGGAVGSDDYPVHRPYLNSETTLAPALARHISAMSGVAITNGAG